MSDTEVEFYSEDDEVGDSLRLENFSQAVLWGTDWTVETVLAQLHRGNIELNPRFQRRDAWSRVAKSRFIESVILGLPIPQVVLAESPEQRGRYIILDGKQRLLSLMQYAGYAEGSASNAFGLSGLDIRTDLARKRYRHLSNDPAFRSDLDAFLTHTIRTVVIRNWPSLQFLHLVFQRLNTGSLKLSPQELRQALVPGPFTDFVDDKTIDSPAVAKLLGRSQPDPRMRDVELLVRALAFKLRLTEYAGRMKDFLDATCLHFNKTWDVNEEVVRGNTESFCKAVSALEEIFSPGGIARKLYSGLFNRSIFDALVYFAMDESTREAMVAKSAAVVAAYNSTLRNESFQIAVESDTAGLPHTADRFRIWGDALKKALEQEIDIPRTEENAQGQQRFAG
jgi:hypothetical protein